MFHGVNICETFVNTSGLKNAFFEIHIAMVQAKSEFGDDIDATIAELKENFFSDARDKTTEPGQFTRRTSSFDDLENGDAYDHKYACLPMSKDKMNIIFHWKRLITPDREQSTNNFNHMWRIDKYFKIMKKVEFDAATSAQPRRPFVIFTWVTTPSGKYWPTWNTDNTQIVVDRDIKHKVYCSNIT